MQRYCFGRNLSPYRIIFCGGTGVLPLISKSPLMGDRYKRGVRTQGGVRDRMSGPIPLIAFNDFFV